MISELPSMTSENFKDYLFRNHRNRLILWIALAAVVIQFAIFKYFYPYPDFLPADSFKYLEIAQRNPSIAIHPVGYSRFIRFFSVLTSSALALTAFQYLLIQASGLLMVFTLSYFYQLKKAIQTVLLGFMIFNPLFLYLANMISSDGYFLALSFCWLSLLLWILHQPNREIIIWHTVVVFLAFTVRHNAMVYPVVATLAFILSRQPVLRKLAGIGAMVLVCGLFVLYTGNKYKTVTGTWQYAPLSGWLTANNGIRTYRYVDSTQRKPVPAKYKAIDQVMRAYLDSSRRSDSKMPMDVTLFMYPPELLLGKYRDLRFEKDTISTELKRWATMAPLYRAYGMQLIRQYPKLYVQHVLWPSVCRYYAPAVGSLMSYNAGADTITASATSWFGYKSNKVITRTGDKEIKMLNAYPVFAGIMNVFMISFIVCFIAIGGFKQAPGLLNDTIVVVTLLILNAELTIFSTLAVLRFMAFPILVSFVFTLLLADRLWDLALQENEKLIQDSGEAENQEKRVGVFS